MLGTGALMQVSVSAPLLVAAFCGTALVYGADRGVVAGPEDEWNRPRRTRWVRAHRAWLYGEGVVLGGIGLLALSALRPRTLVWAGAVAGLGGLHLMSGGTSRLLPPLGVGKPLLVAGTWAVGSTLLPLVEAGAPLGGAAWALAGYRLLFILPNVLLSDWGDRAGDRAAGLSPWTVWGTGRGLRWGATALLVGAILGAVGAGWQGGRPLLWGVDAGGALLMIVAVWGATPQRAAHRFGLDAIVAWPVVTALAAWGGG